MYLLRLGAQVLHELVGGLAEVGVEEGDGLLGAESCPGDGGELLEVGEHAGEFRRVALGENFEQLGVLHEVVDQVGGDVVLELSGDAGAVALLGHEAVDGDAGPGGEAATMGEAASAQVLA